MIINRPAGVIVFSRARVTGQPGAPDCNRGILTKARRGCYRMNNSSPLFAALLL